MLLVTWHLIGGKISLHYIRMEFDTTNEYSSMVMMEDNQIILVVARIGSGGHSVGYLEA